MSRLEHIPTFDFETLLTDTSTCIRPSVLPPSLEDFCAVYDVFQCVWFRRRRKVEREIQAEGRSKRGPSPSLLPESNTESGERAPKTRRTGTNANTSLVASHPRTAATTATTTTTTTANARSTDSPVELSSAHSSTQTLTQTPPSSVLGLLRETYESASSRDQNSWNIEDNHGESYNDNDNGTKDSGSPLDFLQDTTTLYPNNNDSNNNNNDSNSKRNNRQPIAAAAAAANGYCSFVLQDDSNHAVTKFTQRLKEWLVTSAGADANATNRLPYSLLFPGPQQTEDHKTTTTTTTTTVAGENRNSDNNNNNIRVATVAPHCWIFVGRNRAHTTTNNNSDDDDDRNSLPGRPEHTDAVAHDGTVHVQLEGRKVWHLRPTQELIEQCDENYDVALKTDKDEDNSHYYRVCLEEGDVLVVNTRLWWHRTSIPPQPPPPPPPPSSCSPGHRSCCCSVSVARDVYLRDDPTTRTATATRTGTRRSSSSSNNDDKNGSGDSYSVGSGSGIEPDESVDDDDDDDDNRLGHKHKREREHESMSNVDSSWAKGFIPKGTVLLVDRAPVDDHDDEDGDCSHHGRDADDDDDDDANDDNVPARYYDRVPPSIGRTDEKSRANCRLVVRASHEEDDANDETGCKPRGSGDPSSLRQNHDHHPQQQRPTEPKSVPSISKSISISKSKWIALKTIRDIREGEEFVLLLLPRGGIEDEDEQP